MIDPIDAVAAQLPVGATVPDMPEVVDHVAVARLYGEPLFSLPTDLYIPHDPLEVFLAAKINTLGDRAEDVFLIDGARLHDEQALLRLETSLYEQLKI